MTKQEYQTERKARGTQFEVAAMLNIDRTTVARRETGSQLISKEAEIAIKSLPKKNLNKSSKRR